MSYFDHHYVSKSDLVALKHKLRGEDQIENLEEIFEFGTLFHKAVLEPFKITESSTFDEPSIKLALKMAETFRRDSFCQLFLSYKDIRIEHEFYKQNLNGVKAKMKADAESRNIKSLLELKGLALENEKSFESSLEFFDYDMGAAWYLDVSKYNRILIVAISKKNYNKLFKVLVDRNHKLYKSGRQKYLEMTNRWISLGL